MEDNNVPVYDPLDAYSMSLDIQPSNNLSFNNLPPEAVGANNPANIEQLQTAGLSLTPTGPSSELHIQCNRNDHDGPSDMPYQQPHPSQLPRLPKQPLPRAELQHHQQQQLYNHSQHNNTSNSHHNSRSPGRSGDGMVSGGPGYTHGSQSFSMQISPQQVLHNTSHVQHHTADIGIPNHQHYNHQPMMQNHQVEHFTNHQHFETPPDPTAAPLLPPSYEDHMRLKESSTNHTHPTPLISQSLENPKVNVIVTSPSVGHAAVATSKDINAMPAATSTSPNKSPAAAGSGSNSLTVSSSNSTPATSPRPSPNMTPVKAKPVVKDVENIEDFVDIPGINLKKKAVNPTIFIDNLATNHHRMFVNVDSYAERCLACVFRKLKNNLCDLQILSRAVTGGESYRPGLCISVPRSKDCRITVTRSSQDGTKSTKKVHPHLALIQIFSNPQAHNINLIQPIPQCTCPFLPGASMPEMCINPFHYVVSSGLSSTVTSLNSTPKSSPKKPGPKPKSETGATPKKISKLNLDLPCDNDSDSDCLSEDSSDSSTDWELHWKNLQKQKSPATNAEPQKLRIDQSTTELTSKIKFLSLKRKSPSEREEDTPTVQESQPRLLAKLRILEDLQSMIRTNYDLSRSVATCDTKPRTRTRKYVNRERKKSASSSHDVSSGGGNEHINKVEPVSSNSISLANNVQESNDINEGIKPSIVENCIKEGSDLLRVKSSALLCNSTDDSSNLVLEGRRDDVGSRTYDIAVPDLIHEKKDVLFNGKLEVSENDQDIKNNHHDLQLQSIKTEADIGSDAIADANIADDAADSRKRDEMVISDLLENIKESFESEFDMDFSGEFSTQEEDQFNSQSFQGFSIASTYSMSQLNENAEDSMGLAIGEVRSTSSARLNEDAISHHNTQQHDSMMMQLSNHPPNDGDGGGGGMMMLPPDYPGVVDGEGMSGDVDEMPLIVDAWTVPQHQQEQQLPSIAQTSQQDEAALNMMYDS